MKKLLMCLGCALAVASGSASAGLIYNEAVSGDSHPWYIGGAALGSVHSGDYVLGRMENTGADSYWDGYNFILDGTVKSINIVALTGPLNNSWQLYAGASGNSTLQNGTLNAINTPISFNVTGLNGTFSLGNNGNTPSLPYNYQISFDTAAKVPEPGSLALFGLAVAGFGALRRRKA